jgi:tetratricopeptide (TPR) repeat protein
VACAVLASCSGGSSSGKSTSSDSFATLVGAGNALLKQRNPGAAEQLFAQAIRKAPANPLGYYDAGVADQQLGENQAALAQYARAVRANSRYAPALFNTATIYNASDPDRAMYLYRRVITIQADSPTAYLNLGILEARKPRDASQSTEDLQMAVRLEPSLLAKIPARLRRRLHAAQKRVGIATPTPSGPSSSAG